MISTNDFDNVSKLIEEGRIARFRDILMNVNPERLQEKSGILQRRLEEIARRPESILVTEIHQLAEALKISRSQLFDLLKNSLDDSL
jgi:hypothetical protein